MVFRRGAHAPSLCRRGHVRRSRGLHLAAEHTIETPTSEPNGLTTQPRLDNDDDNDNEAQWPDRRLIKQSDKVARLDAYANDVAASIIPTRLHKRPDLLVERSRLRALGDVDGVARLNAVLSTEAFDRAAQMTTRWLDRRDPASGLFPHTLRPKDRLLQLR